MSRPISEVENLLQLLIAEHRKLLKHVEQQQAAMKALDLKAMDAAAQQQEASRLRIATLENRRRQLCVQLARAAKLTAQQEITVKKLAEMNPQRAPALLALRDELREVIGEIQKRTHIAGRLAGAVLGHLNTVVRVLAGAVEQATGVYTKHGTPHVATRIGVMNAVG